MATEVGDPGAVAFERALAEERRLNVRRLGLLRFMAVSVFFALFLLVSEVTRRQAGDAIEFARAGPAHLRGRSQAVEVYEPRTGPP